jgi:hypothetical protein
MNSEILDKLIMEGESLTSTIAYVPAGPNVIRTYSVYKTSEQDRYQDWQSSAQRFVKTSHPSDLDEVKEAAKKLSPDNHRKILGVLRAIKLLPKEPVIDASGRNTSTNNIHITNTQNNSQQVSLNFFMEAIKDELTGKDLKELKEILKSYEADPIKTKSALIERIKGLGGDVLSSIVANILTNPVIYSGLF